MKKVLIMSVLCLSILLSNNTCNDNLLRAGIGSNEFGVAFLGLAAAFLIRGGDKK